MLFKASLIDILFNFSIFFLLVYQVHSILKSHFIPFLFRQLQSERDQHTRIVEKQRLLISNRHRLQNQIYNQKNIFTLLEMNVQVWHKMMSDEKSNKESTNKKLAESIREKRILQRKTLALEKKIHLILPQAVEQARISMGKKHSTEDGKKVLSRILQNLC